MTKLQQQIALLMRMDQLIRRKATGTPEEFALRLGISQRGLYKYISFMKKALNAPIRFCKHRKCYRYDY
ncbi:MAG: hypothetical protein CUN55_18095, partial [Phototrophicales bacterium]